MNWKGVQFNSNRSRLELYRSLYGCSYFWRVKLPPGR